MSIYEIYKSSSFDQNLFIIVDSIRIKDKVENLAEFNYENIFDRTNESGTPDEFSPLIFEINLYNCKNEMINELWAKDDVLTIICTKLDKKSILNKLRNLLYLEDHLGNRYLFRWFDSRIIKNIKYLFSEDDLKDIFDGVDKWYLKKINIIEDRYFNFELIEDAYGL